MEKVPNKNLERVLRLTNLVSDRIGNENLAILLMTVSCVFWPMAFLYVSEHHFPPFQTNLVRGVAICASHILICNALGIELNCKSWPDIKTLLIRNTLIGIHQLVYAAMHFVLSYPLINSIVITGPLFVFIVDYYLNGVTINYRQMVGIFLSFMGILLNINGEMLMTFIDPSFEISSTYQNYEVTDIQTKILFSLVAVLTNVAWAYGIVVQKKVRHLPGIKISFFLGMEFLFTSGVVVSSGAVKPIGLGQSLTAMFASGLVMAFCQVLFMSSLNLTKNAGKMTIINLVYAVTAYAISFFRYDEEINLICLSGLLLMGYGLYRTIFTASS